MRTRLIAAVAVLAAVALPATGSAGPVTKADKVNGARACAALKSSLGAATFKLLSRTNGACVSAWTRTAHQKRHGSEVSCRAEGRKGTALAACMKTRTATRIAQARKATQNAARQCKAERATLGAAAFARTYGRNANDRNAFGKCVSQKVNQRDDAGGERTFQYEVTLGALNNSGVSGTAMLRLKGDQLAVTINASGLEAGKEHMQHIHGLAERAASSCNVSTADANADGRVSNPEGSKVYGDPLLDLTPFPTASSTGTVAYFQTFTVDMGKLFPLTSRAIVLHGLTVNGTYDAALPVACGLIEQK